MDNFWKGTFAPMKKSCQHGSTSVSLGEAEQGLVPVYVEFNHTCSGNPAPSNDKTYTFEIELDDFTSGSNDAVIDLQNELDKMTDSQKLKWINDNLTFDGGSVDTQSTFW